MTFEKIILASKSPRRSQLLQWAEIKFDVITADTDESYPKNFPPHEVAIHIAVNKAMDVKKGLRSPGTNGDDYPILAADTIVVLDNKIIGKPSDRAEAINTLLLLSGVMHRVVTGVCILSAGKKIVFAEETEVEFNALSKKHIEYYVDNYKPYDKAGAYAIQEWIGVTGIKSIKGDFYNVMGLPVSRIVKELKGLKILY
ncbi:MAG: Maf family nucleotide pyrophosphatase [Bacteroidota bacterium]|nr:Maf family nucleotide pyrophosphatase [Bacteroidota bacterium]